MYFGSSVTGRTKARGNALFAVVVLVGALLVAAPAVAAVNPVVDDNLIGVDAGDCAAGATTHNSIQAAVNAADPGDVVFVCPGTFDEQLDIDKQVTLMGSGVGVSIVQPTVVPLDPWVVGAGPAADVHVDGAADGSVIEGFTFDFNGATNVRTGLGFVISDLNGPLGPVTDVTIRNNAIEVGVGLQGIVTGANANVGGLVITGNAFHGTGGYEGIYINPNTAGTVMISNNTLDENPVYGISVESDRVTVTGNAVVNTTAPHTVLYTGIRVFDSGAYGPVDWTTLTISGNSVTGFEKGLRLGDSAERSSAIAIAATGNSLTSNTIGIQYRWDVAVTASLNSIAGNTAGVAQLATADGTVNATCNWWGDSSGPGGSGPGTGDTVSAGVLFDPWFSTADVSGPCGLAGLAAGGSVTVGTGTPTEITLTTPTGGAVTIVGNPAGASPAGFVLFGQEFTITAPDEAAGTPLVIVFTIDPAITPPGTTLAGITVFRNGLAVPACVGPPGTAFPDPCVSSRVLTGGGDFQITVLTSTASLWSFATFAPGGGGGGGGEADMCAGLPATIVGTEAGETILGTSGNDVIVGLGGDDVISGRGGNDVICGGDGDDTIKGRGGADRIFGDAGMDVIIGNTGRDRLHGGEGADQLWGGKHNDRIFGDAGDDTLYGGNGRRDYLDGGAGDNYLDGGPGGADHGVNGPTLVNIELT